MIPSVQGLNFRVDTGSIEVPLEKPEGSGATDDGLRPPKLGASAIGKELELQPIREFAVRELLSKAKNGTATVVIPLMEATLKKGPLKIKIPDGTKVVINIVVRDGHIIREQASGSFEPPIDLPLGLEFRGILLDDDGAIVADISRFPNIDLSWLSSSLRVPETLAEVLLMVFPDKSSQEESAASGKSESSVGIIAEEIVVTAGDIKPCQEPVDLGPFGHFALGPDTLLHAEFGPDLLRVHGRIHIGEASVHGHGFSAKELAGQGDVEFLLRRNDEEKSSNLRCHFDSFTAGHAEIVLMDGSRAALADVTAKDADILVMHHDREVHWSATANQISGSSREGLFFAHIESQQHQVSLGPSPFSGSLSLSDRDYELDLNLDHLEVSIGEHPLPLGVMHFDVIGSTALIAGRLSISSKSGYAFSGSIATDSQLSGGHFDLGLAKGRIREGTQLQLKVSALKGMRGLSSLEAEGIASMHLHSATLDLGEKSLGLSQGATGKLAMSSIRLSEDKQWPSIIGTLQLATHIDPTTLNGVMELPGLEVVLTSDQVKISDEGHLILGEMSVAGTSPG
jgi:hypothetical protein